MSNISGLAVLTLGLERTNLLKENRIQAELPFSEQNPPFKCGTKQVCCCQLSECFSAAFVLKICAFSLHRAAQAFEETTH